MFLFQYLPIVIIITLVYFYLVDRHHFKNGYLKLETAVILNKFEIPEELYHIDFGSKLIWFVSANHHLFSQNERIELLSHLDKAEKLLRKKKLL